MEILWNNLFVRYLISTESLYFHWDNSQPCLCNFVILCITELQDRRWYCRIFANFFSWQDQMIQSFTTPKPSRLNQQWDGAPSCRVRGESGVVVLNSDVCAFALRRPWLVQIKPPEVDQNRTHIILVTDWPIKLQSILKCHAILRLMQIATTVRV